jgi:hypothetical protein
MPAYQSLTDFSLTQKYHLKAVGCEEQAQRATDRITEQEWRQLAAQWHSMSDQAATMSGEGFPGRRGLVVRRASHLF